MRKTDTRRGLALAALALMFGGTTAEAATAQQLCFPYAYGVPGDSGPPDIDAVIHRDMGWTGAFRYEFGNATSVSHGVVQGARDSRNVYLSFEVNNDTRFDAKDVMVLMFDTGASTNRYQRLHVYPLFDGTGHAVNGVPFMVRHYQGETLDANGKVRWGTPDEYTHDVLASGGFWLDVKVGSTNGGAANLGWHGELAIPIAASASDPGIPFPSSADFKVYLYAMRVNMLFLQGSALHWPENAFFAGDSVELDSDSPPVSQWGDGSFGTTGCGGVSFSWRDITTSNTPVHELDLRGTNTFYVTLHNNSVDDAGNPIPANDIYANFKIANFGLPSPWSTIPVPSNPAYTAQIPANGTATLNTGAWDLTEEEEDAYAAEPHQCILVELTSKDERTLFSPRSAWRNMEFIDGEEMERAAEIGTKGYPLPKGWQKHRFELVATPKARVVKKGEDDAEETRAELRWLFNGYRHTGVTVLMDKQQFQLVEPVGAFGFVLRRPLQEGEPLPSPKGMWGLDVEGLEPNPDRNDPDSDVRYYQVEIDEGDALRFITRAKYLGQPDGK